MGCRVESASGQGAESRGAPTGNPVGAYSHLGEQNPGPLTARGWGPAPRGPGDGRFPVRGGSYRGGETLRPEERPTGIHAVAAGLRDPGAKGFPCGLAIPGRDVPAHGTGMKGAHVAISKTLSGRARGTMKLPRISSGTWDASHSAGPSLVGGLGKKAPSPRRSASPEPPEGGVRPKENPRPLRTSDGCPSRIDHCRAMLFVLLPGRKGRSRVTFHFPFAIPQV